MFDCSNVPVEIWHLILLAIIEVPWMLDTLLPTDRSYWDDTDRYHNAQGYTDSERQRRTLRLVCHSWRAFADQHKHRCITYSTDPGAKLADQKKALDAIYSTTEQGGAPVNSTPRRILFNILRNQDFDTFRHMIENCTSKTSILFIECLPIYEDKVFDYVMSRSTKLPALRNLGIYLPTQGMPLRAISTAFPKLTTLGISDLSTILVYSSDDRLFLPELQMLRIDLAAFPTSSIKTWEIPSLIHLITQFDSERPERFEPFQILGPNLLILYIYRLDIPLLLPRDFWSWCPRLQEFSTLLSHLYFEPPIPPTHPLKYIFHWPQYDGRDVSIADVPTSRTPLLLHNLQLLPTGFERLTIWKNWQHYLTILSPRFMRKQRERILFRMNAIAVEKGICVEDEERVTVGEFIASSEEKYGQIGSLGPNN